MEKFAKLTLAGLLILAAMIGIALFTTLPIWFLWNALLPSLFGFPSITFMQALGISLLCSFLFPRGTSFTK